MIRSATTLVLGILLAAAPVSMSIDGDTSLGVASALAKAGGNGKGNGNVGSNSNAGGSSNGTASANAGGNGKGNGKGTANGLGVGAQPKGQLAKSDPLASNKLGRLNSLKSEHSTAAKIIGGIYAGQLSAFIGTLTGLTASPADPTLTALAQTQLEAAATTLATVANKPLSPEIIAYVNGYAAAQNPTDTNLASLAGPSAADLASADPAIQAAAQAAAAANAALVANLLTAANTADTAITNNGLGPLY